MFLVSFLHPVSDTGLFNTFFIFFDLDATAMRWETVSVAKICTLGTKLAEYSYQSP